MYRWCLTGTPIHNSIDDYGALLSFIGIYPFEEKSGFDYWIASPLKENRAGSLKLLRDLVRATCLRRTKASSTVCLNLEKIIEKTEQVRLHQEDQHLYNLFKKKTADIAAGMRHVDKDNSSPKPTGDENILSLMNVLRAICNHGKESLPSSALSAWESSDISQVDWKMVVQTSRIICTSCGQDCAGKQSRSSSPSLDVAYDIDLCEDCAMVGDEKPILTKSAKEASVLITMDSSKTPGSPENSVRPSAKVVRLLHNLQEEQRGHIFETPKKRHVIPRYVNSGSFHRADQAKSVIFSQSTTMLDLIALTLNSHRFRFQRIDGQTSLENRCDALRQFNEVPQCTIMLASIGSCSEGYELSSAAIVWTLMVD
jgi:SNF2 family DNA or RNA helicase